MKTLNSVSFAFQVEYVSKYIGDRKFSEGNKFFENSVHDVRVCREFLSDLFICSFQHLLFACLPPRSTPYYENNIAHIIGNVL